MKHCTLLVVTLITFFGYHSASAQSKNPSEFVPNGHVILETIYGDLNNDKLEDCILLIKGTDKNNIVINRFDVAVDRNRRGIVILLNTKDGYDMVLNNQDCFYSENEDGGVYYAPQLFISIDTGNLHIDYNHGRYGLWKYTFRYQDSDLELIGYDAISMFGPVIQHETSINFLTKKKLTRENTNYDAEGNDEVFKETWSTIKLNKRIKLSEIADFEEIDMSLW